MREARGDGAAMIRVLLAEGQAMVRGVLAALLSLESDIEIVAEVARGDEVAAAAGAAHPPLAPLDSEIAGCDGLTAAAGLPPEPATLRGALLTTVGAPSA